jgi:hypothetical protein
MTKAREIELHIEELVLHGFDPAMRRSIGRAMEQALARLIAERGVSPAIAHLQGATHEEAPSIEVDRAASAGEIGAKIAAAVCGSKR